jgi:hypothetical protein
MGSGYITPGVGNLIEQKSLCDQGGNLHDSPRNHCLYVDHFNANFHKIFKIIISEKSSLLVYKAM